MQHASNITFRLAAPHDADAIRTIEFEAGKALAGLEFDRTDSVRIVRRGKAERDVGSVLHKCWVVFLGAIPEDSPDIDIATAK